ncbi:MAG: hypothetical protein HOM03_10605 [Marinovum sp.]|nr:hypothetical protein [Marinovum sp.]
MPRITYKKSVSMGEAISSLCFFFVGVIWLSHGVDFFETGNLWRALGLFICAIISFAACLRFVIQNFVFNLMGAIDAKRQKNQRNLQ